MTDAGTSQFTLGIDPSHTAVVLSTGWTTGSPTSGPPCRSTAFLPGPGRTAARTGAPVARQQPRDPARDDRGQEPRRRSGRVHIVGAGSERVHLRGPYSTPGRRLRGAHRHPRRREPGQRVPPTPTPSTGRPGAPPWSPLLLSIVAPRRLPRRATPWCCPTTSTRGTHRSQCGGDPEERRGRDCRLLRTRPNQLRCYAPVTGR